MLCAPLNEVFEFYLNQTHIELYNVESSILLVVGIIFLKFDCTKSRHISIFHKMPQNLVGLGLQFENHAFLKSGFGEMSNKIFVLEHKSCTSRQTQIVCSTAALIELSE